jgi:nicotinamide-nucleotide amidase
VSGEGARAGIVVTGTEVLSGTISDRNGPWLSVRLGELGVDVAHILCVGDRPGDMEAALGFLAGEGVDLIVTSGGLGPTADDLTAEIVARFAGRPLELDPRLEGLIGEILAEYGRRLDFDAEALRAANRKQALVPRGAVPLDPVGTAPGLVVPVDEGPVVLVLPGPPRELQAMWPRALETEPLREVLARARPYRTTRLRLYGVPESEIAASLRELEAEGVALERLEITTCLRGWELEVDVRWLPQAERELEALVEGLAARHGPRLYSRDGSTLDDQLAELLQGRSLGLAESCTGGMLAARLTARPGASAYLAGGVVAYSNEAKVELLGVPAELIERHGAVSPQVAEAMADGAIARFGAQFGVGITGVAGPGGGSDHKPVGYVCICVKGPDGARLARDPRFPGSRQEVRERSVVLAMHLLRRALLGESGDGNPEP